MSQANSSSLLLAIRRALASSDRYTKFKERLQKLSGADSKDCGMVVINVGQPSWRQVLDDADHCAIEAFAQHKSFRVGRYGMNIDSVNVEGFAEDKSQRVFYVYGWHSMIPGGKGASQD